MSAALRTLEAWKSFCRETSRSGGENVWSHNGVTFSFDARPRPLANGALQGRIYAQPWGETPRDIGGFKIAADGDVVALPEEVKGLLPEPFAKIVGGGDANNCVFPGEENLRPDPFSTDDVEAP